MIECESRPWEGGECGLLRRYDRLGFGEAGDVGS
jgi:hypothetical protein